MKFNLLAISIFCIAFNFKSQCCYANCPCEFTVTASKLNIRKAPSETSVVIGHLNIGDTVSLNKYNDYWAEIYLNENMKGYISTRYIKSLDKTEIAKDKVQLFSTVSSLVILLVTFKYFLLLIGLLTCLLLIKHYAII